MREILFRGKRLDNGKWVEGAFCPKNCDDPFGPMVDRPSIIKLGEPCDGFWYDVDPATVGEYTGLTDKNGKKIFAGDILRVFDEESGNEGDGVCVVHFGRFKDTDSLSDFDHLGFYVTVSTLPGEATTIFALEEDGIAFEVIGNIHDNPELLADA